MCVPHREVPLLVLPDGTPWHYFVDWPVHVQVMSSTKHDVYHKCMSQVLPDIAETMKMFDRTQHLCLSDGDGSVAAAFRYLRCTSPLKNQLRYECDVHKLSNMMKSTMSPDVVQGHITGMLALALSLRSANGMRLFRQALREVISERLVFQLRKPSTKDLQRNAAIANMCVQDRSHAEIERGGDVSSTIAAGRRAVKIAIIAFQWSRRLSLPLFRPTRRPLFRGLAGLAASRPWDGLCFSSRHTRCCQVRTRCGPRSLQKRKTWAQRRPPHGHASAELGNGPDGCIDNPKRTEEQVVLGPLYE